MMVIGVFGKVFYCIWVKILIDEGIFVYLIMWFVKVDVEVDLFKLKKCLICKGKGEDFDVMMNNVMVCEFCKGIGFCVLKYFVVYKSVIVELDMCNKVFVEIVKIVRKLCMFFVEKFEYG